MMQSIASKPIQPGPPNEPSNEVRLPYFSLLVGTNGTLLVAEGGYYDLSDQTFLNELLDASLETEANTGVILEYNLRFYRVAIPGGQRIVYTDISSEQATLNSLLITSLISGSLSFLVFLGISILLARWATRPVEEAWKQQRQFVSDASHELKTPLTVILTNAEMLQNPEFEEDRKSQFRDNILTMAKQMRNLVERLLDLARSDNEANHLPFTSLSFSTLVTSATLPFEPLFFEQGLTSSSELEPDIELQGNEASLRQLIDILLDNACKYATSPGNISITLSKKDRHHCLLTVANPGEAIQENDLKNIFKRFYRLDQARKRDGSFGLGLSIADSIAKNHHGRIWAESHDGLNIFRVELPIEGATSKPCPSLQA